MSCMHTIETAAAAVCRIFALFMSLLQLGLWLELEFRDMIRVRVRWDWPTKLTKKRNSLCISFSKCMDIADYFFF